MNFEFSNTLLIWKLKQHKIQFHFSVNLCNSYILYIVDFVIGFYIIAKKKKTFLQMKKVTFPPSDIYWLFSEIWWGGKHPHKFFEQDFWKKCSLPSQSSDPIKVVWISDLCANINALYDKHHLFQIWNALTSQLSELKLSK